MDFNFTDWWQKQNNLGRVLIGALALIVFFIGGQISPPRPSSIHFVISFFVLLTTIGLFFLNQKGKTQLAAHLLLIVLYLPSWLYYFINVKIHDFSLAVLLAFVMIGIAFISTIIVPTKSVILFSTTTFTFLYVSNQLYPAPIQDTRLLQQILLFLIALSTAFGWAYNKKQQLAHKNQQLIEKKQSLSQENQQIYQQNQTLLSQLTALSQQIEASSQELQHIKTQNQHLYQENTAIQQQNQHIQQQNTHLQQSNKRLQAELMAAYKKADVLLEDLKQHKQSLKQSTQEKLLALTRLEETQKLLDLLYEKSGDAPPPPLGEVHLVGTVGNEKHPKPYNDNGDIIFTLHVVNLKKPQYLFKYKVLLSGNMTRGVNLAPSSPLYVVGDLKTMYTKHIIRRTKRGVNIPGVDMPQIHVTFIQTLDDDDLQLNKTFGVYINTLRTYHLRQSDDAEN